MLWVNANEVPLAFCDVEVKFGPDLTCLSHCVA